MKKMILMLFLAIAITATSQTTVINNITPTPNTYYYNGYYYPTPYYSLPTYNYQPASAYNINNYQPSYQYNYPQYPTIYPSYYPNYNPYYVQPQIISPVIQTIIILPDED